jgi:RNA polymerase sigma-70 factor (ECF subfamily)
MGHSVYTETAVERQLLLSIARGNEQAFRNFYENFVPYVTKVVHKYKREGMMAVEDHVQEVFSAVWKYRANLNRVENIHFYLFTITKNKVLDFEKNQARNRNLRLDEAYAAWFSQEPSVALDYQYILRMYRESIASLPPRQKKVFQLRYEAGLSGHEVGRLMGITHFTVKNLHRMAKEKLMKNLLARLN